LKILISHFGSYALHIIADFDGNRLSNGQYATRLPQCAPLQDCILAKFFADNIGCALGLASGFGI